MSPDWMKYGIKSIAKQDHHEGYLRRFVSALGRI